MNQTVETGTMGDEQMEAMAQALDAGRDLPAEAQNPPPAAPAGETPKPDISEPKGAGEQQTEVIKPTETAPPEPAKAGDAPLKPDDPPESNYAKAEKERQRQENLLKNFEADKAAFRAEREKFEAERAETARLRAEAETYRDANGKTAKEYREFAENTDDEELRKQATAAADRCEAEAMAARRNNVVAKFQKDWTDNAQKLVAEHPEFADPTSEQGRALKAVLDEFPAFYTVTDGLRHAWTILDLRRKAGSVDALSKENEDYKKEIDRLNQCLAPSGGGTHDRSNPKMFEQMSTEEQDAFLTRQAAMIDQGG